MTMERVMFYLMSVLALGSGIYIAASKNLVRSVFMFFVTLMAVAGLYVLCMADFVAITQVVIYVGGILVLIIFAFMLSGRETLSALQHPSNKFISINKVPAFLLAVLFFIVMLNVIVKGNVSNIPWTEKSVLAGEMMTAKDTTVNNIGINLMGNYLLPFEVVSILLMMALVGAAHLSRKERGV
ncbi:MAG: NADH-quinone oxidoreductase subunit J [Bacteroidetes bacterium]|nr:NADH-quinone oxidoreductase subunit J [Bacteroidota bacterium]